MAKVSLRIYNREIESMVDSGQLDEAIAHCRHILNEYPKHLETYRMIGKAYLEAKRYDEATDIFERILMAVPDDFVAHVGMSIIRDEQNSLDAAIWHMQRAFEVQPSNAAIQSELQRLYGRRDGIEPPKIRLTRGALAHMYVQGELYPQAIAEIKAVLEEDPERHDMQVLLARAYFHAGQQSDAAEMCSQLLRRYPYCFEANRVLVELLPQTERGESAQVHRHRVNELDPYAAFVTGSVFHSEEVSDAAVNLERLEWDGQPIEVQPEWRESRGIGRGEEATSGDAEPDWLKSGLTAGSLAASGSTEEPASASGASSGGQDDIPDFLREAGWGEDTGTFQEGLSSFGDSDESSDDTPLAQGDLPDWVKAMAPADAALEAASSQPEPEEDLAQDDVPDWLQGLGDPQSSSDNEQPAAEGDLPDWLESMKPAEESAPQVQEQPEEQTIAEPTSDDDLPDWLESMKPAEETVSPLQEQPEEQTIAEPTNDDDLPDWLESMKPVQEQPEEQTMAEPTSDDDLPDWLKAMQSEEEPKEERSELPEFLRDRARETPQELQSQQEEEAPEFSEESLSDWQIGDEDSTKAIDFDTTDTGMLGTSAEEQDDAVAWLESLASKHGAKPEELVTDPNARSETAPDWVQKAQSMQGQAETPAPQEEPVAQEPTPPVEQVAPPAAPVSVDDLGTSAEEQDDAVAWLESLASKHGAKPEELVTDPNARSETAPDWVQKAQAMQGQEQVEASAPQEEAPVAQEPEQPSASVSVDDLGTSAEEQDDAVAWLESLASKHGAKPEELVTDPNARSETAPEWVQKAVESGAESAIGERPTAPPAEEPAESEPDWMKEAKEVGESLYAELEESQTKEPIPSADTDETGMWLRDLGDDGDFAKEQGEQPAAEGDIPDWLSDLETEESTADSAEELESAPEPEATPQPADEAEPEPPEWLRSMEAEIPGPEAAATSGDDASLPDWLRDIDESPAEAESVPASLEEESLPTQEVTEKIDINNATIQQLAVLPGIGDLLAQDIVAHRETFGDFSSVDDLSNIAGIGPATIDELRGLVEFGEVHVEDEDSSVTDWLQKMETEASEETVEEPAAVETGADDDLPSWLAGLDGETETEVEQPQAEAESDADLPSWLRAETEAEPAVEQPTASSDWKPVDAAEPPETAELEPEPEPKAEEPPVAPPPVVASAESEEPELSTTPAREPYREPITSSRTGMTGMLSSAQDPALTQAQDELTHGNISGAMDHYSKLIKKGKLLEEIIFDLREALYRYPVDVTVMQTLGDAYMRANRLQEALDAYTKAEELLR